eukprot:PLAT6068.1.p1 GENE.PLAT6068.1~~PLAT6068.1.p1  ORF type:complete len:199 (-),score=52.77 PLAT6068.1:110-676(-)
MLRAASTALRPLARPSLPAAALHSSSLLCSLDASTELHARTIVKATNRRVVDVLSERPTKPCLVTPDTNVRSAMQEMAKRNIGSLMIVDDDRLVGIFTERDAVRLMSGDHPSFEAEIREVMTPSPESVHHETGVMTCMNRMNELNIRHLPVVDRIDGRPLGMVSIKDVVRAYLGMRKQQITFLQDYYL